MIEMRLAVADRAQPHRYLERFIAGEETGRRTSDAER